MNSPDAGPPARTPPVRTPPVRTPPARPRPVRLPVGRTVSVEVPATSANLGPGFDCFGLALDWRDRCRFEVVEQGWRADVSGEGAATVPTDEHHLVLATARLALDRLGVEVPGLALTAHNTIPHGRGLGSSSAAIVAGLLGAAGLADTLADPAGWLGLATEIEGHPDNVAAALYGNFVLAFEPVDPGRTATGQAGIGAVAIEAHPDIRALLFVPELPLSTEQARSLLPATVPHRDAAADAGRAALFVHALSRDPSLLFEATADWLHQRYRAAAMPRSSALLESLRDDGFAAVVSGAGPSLLVLGDTDRTTAARRWAGSAAGSAPASGFRLVEVGVGIGARLV